MNCRLDLLRTDIKTSFQMIVKNVILVRQLVILGLQYNLLAEKSSVDGFSLKHKFSDFAIKYFLDQAGVALTSKDLHIFVYVILSM